MATASLKFSADADLADMKVGIVLLCLTATGAAAVPVKV